MNKLKNFFDVTMIKFILVGIVNTAVGMGTMFICYNFFHLSYWVSSASNYVVGSIVSYFLNKYFTFQNKSTVCYLVAYGVAKPLAIWAFSSFDKGIQDNIAMLAGSVFFVGLNYIGQRFWAFKEE